MKNNKKIPARAATRTGERHKSIGGIMSFIYSITKMSRRQVRDLVVRAVEDVIVLLIMGAGIWVICTLVSEIFEKLGVA